MEKIKISHIEWHIVHSCNLTCDGCAHYSNYGHDGMVNYDDLKKWYSYWNYRLSPQVIDILGGEPLLHKDLLKIISLTREYWDDVNLKKLNLQSNGLLLDRFPDLPKVLKENNCHISLSKHDDSPKYNLLFEKSVSLLMKWKEEYGIEIEIIDFTNFWAKLYKGYGSNMEPYEDNDPEESWNNCFTGQDCFQLLDGCIYKCAPLAYLPMVNKKFKLSNKWDHYLTYKPLMPTASYEEIEKFFNMGAESYCAMCPKSIPFYKKPDPLIPRKKIYIKNIA